MKRRFTLSLTASLVLGVGTGVLLGQAPNPEPDQNPTGNTGALKEQIQTAGSYDAHSGNGTRIIPDLHLPGALGVYGLDFTRYWNSLPIAFDNPDASDPADFGISAWTHSWRWEAVYGEHGPEPIPGSDQETNTDLTSISITFPDGHVRKYSVIRLIHGENGIPADDRFGPPYSVAEANNWTTPGFSHEHLSEMALDGSEFWLYLEDGGSGLSGQPGVDGFYSQR